VSDLSITEDFDRRAANYEQQSRWSTSLDVAAPALELLADHSIGRVLDIGGGTGAFASRLIKVRGGEGVVVLDPSQEMLARVPAGITTVQGTIEEFDPKGQRFDTALLRQVLHYLVEPSDALSRITALLDEEGRLYVGQIVAPNEVSATWLEAIGRELSPNRQRVWTADGILSALLGSGFRIIGARLIPYRDSVAAWSDRTPRTIDTRILLEEARARLQSDQMGGLAVSSEDPKLEFTVYWVHCLAEPGRV
jgi:SAM-dependent methyltransferase